MRKINTRYNRIKILIVFYTLFLVKISLAQGHFYAHDYERDNWQKPELIMDTIGVEAGMTIGEVGAGDGYFTAKLVRRVGESGLIYANDIKEYFVRDINNYRKLAVCKNVKTILGTEENPRFPDSTMDMVVMVYVFHHLTNPVSIMQNIKPSLKLGAKVFIIDPDPVRF